jgi:histone-lysine N-methyltransferase SETMAR
MFWNDFSRTGIHAMVMLRAGESFNMDFFAGTVLPSLAENSAQTRPKLKVRRLFLHRHNSRPLLTPEQSADFGITRLPHPPYSQNLSPCDFWRFGYLRHCLEGRAFDDDLTLKRAVSEDLRSIGPDVFVTAIHKSGRGIDGQVKLNGFS